MFQTFYVTLFLFKLVYSFDIYIGMSFIYIYICMYFVRIFLLPGNTDNKIYETMGLNQLEVHCGS